MDLKQAVSIFKLTRYFDPTKINELKPTSSDIENLRALSYLEVDGLKSELAVYMAIANGLVEKA